LNTINGTAPQAFNERCQRGQEIGLKLGLDLGRNELLIKAWTSGTAWRADKLAENSHPSTGHRAELAEAAKKAK
jgi:hypothetical protein